MDTRVITPEGSFLIKRYPRELCWLTHCLKNQYITYWKKLKMGLISNGPIHYHQDRGHTTENCRILRDHLGQLTRVGKLDQFLHQPIGQFGHKGAEFHKGGSPPPARGTINVILARPGNNGTSGTRVMSVGMGCDTETDDQPSKRARVMVTPTLTFSLKDK